MNPNVFLLMLALLAGIALAADVPKGKDLSKGGTVLLLGDSIFDCHEGDKRLDVVLKGVLEKAAPQGKWTVVNAAHGGEYIGPKEGEAAGTSGPLFTDDKGGR